MSGIFGGGGSGKSKTEASAEIPAELKPLATSSVRQIQSAQEALPLSSFASPQLQQVAGLSPFTVAGMNLVPFTTQTTAPEQALFGMQPVWQDLMNRSVGLSRPSAASQSATDYLLGQLGIPGSASSGLGTGLAPASAQAGPLPFSPLGQLPQSVFGPSAPMTIPPVTEAVPSMPITPLMPTAPIPAPAPVPAAGGAGAAANFANMQFAANPYGPPGSIIPLTGQMVQSPWGGPDMDRALVEAYAAADWANQQRQGM